MTEGREEEEGAVAARIARVSKHVQARQGAATKKGTQHETGWMRRLVAYASAGRRAAAACDIRPGVSLTRCSHASRHSRPRRPRPSLRYEACPFARAAHPCSRRAFCQTPSKPASFVVSVCHTVLSDYETARELMPFSFSHLRAAIYLTE